jgi:hypothetical protein
MWHRMGRLITAASAAVLVSACVPPRPARQTVPTPLPDAVEPRDVAPEARLPQDALRPLDATGDTGLEALSRGDTSAAPASIPDAATPVDASPPDAKRPTDAAIPPRPGAEQSCDGEDDDGDGLVDEDLGCYVDIVRARWTNRHDNGDYYYAREPGVPPYWNCDSGGCGVQGPRFVVYAEPGVPGTVPLHLLFDELEVDHLLLADPDEVQARVAQGARYLGTLGHVYPADHPGRADAAPLVRLHNRDVHTWLFTVIPAEQRPPAFVATDVPTICCLAFATAPPP